MATRELTLDTDLFGELRFEVTYDYSPFRPGRYSGPPEDCYPDEPEEFYIATITILGLPVIDPTLSVVESLSPDFLEYIEDALLDEIHEDFNDCRHDDYLPGEDYE